MTPLKDPRYTVRLEHCGYAEPRYVARFCGEWIGQSQFKSAAMMLCLGHDARRKGAEVITEATNP